ncbi:MAG: TetM/TetW/TetO/TetS family tetracycline resistance ribosomal protection protein, partial [Oscillospiraceae bacterium]|nr:TetM/TetW/TetO/TetS family tetracycline resistance ribosomal protection protein [Oscillospiraceae bacterium]
SATDGIQAQTLTLWRLLERYQVPVFLFFNKTDLPGKSRQALLDQLNSRFCPGFVDLSQPLEEAAESIAMCDEEALEEYLQTGSVSRAQISQLVQLRKLFPCCFGSALKLEGIDTLTQLLDSYCPRPAYPGGFGARVYKISRDPQGNRLTWLKLTGGSLSVRQLLRYENADGTAIEEKIVQLRLYSGDKFTAPEEVFPGQLCAVTGLTATSIGMGLGTEISSPPPAIQPVMTYRVELPAGGDPAVALQKLRQLEEEDPQLHIFWDAPKKQIHIQCMGRIQQEVLRSIIAQRFNMEITLDSGRIFYKETITEPVEGIGHFEPLRHYAEVHLLLEPLPAGRGLEFETRCPTDVLDGNFQRLVLTHLKEKTHLGVLTGSPITDLRISLLTGRAHVKHTEGGDFRQATYRAVRQGLMQAKNQLLEPWYDFTLTLPSACVGRAITDIRNMQGELDPPETVGEDTVLTGWLPAATLGDYPEQLAAYTQGQGILQLAFRGYAPCHNTQKVLEENPYDPEADLENTPDSVFCDHGAGVTVKWNRVRDFMHLESGWKQGGDARVITGNLHISDKTLDAALAKQFGTPATRLPATSNRPATEKLTIRPPRSTALIVDGYNIIFAWQDLADTAKSDLSAARRLLCDRLASYAGFRKTRVVVVFDGYKVKGNPGEKEVFHNIQVVYTKENQTADAYMEELIAQIGPNYSVQVATSDALIQLSSVRSGVLRVSARELEQELEATQQEMKKYMQQ